MMIEEEGRGKGGEKEGRDAVGIADILLCGRACNCHLMYL